MVCWHGRQVAPPFKQCHLACRRHFITYNNKYLLCHTVSEGWKSRSSLSGWLRLSVSEGCDQGDGLKACPVLFPMYLIYMTTGRGHSLSGHVMWQPVPPEPVRREREREEPESMGGKVFYSLSSELVFSQLPLHTTDHQDQALLMWDRQWQGRSEDPRGHWESTWRLLTSLIITKDTSQMLIVSRISVCVCVCVAPKIAIWSICKCPNQ